MFLLTPALPARSTGALRRGLKSGRCAFLRAFEGYSVDVDTPSCIRLGSLGQPAHQLRRALAGHGSSARKAAWPSARGASCRSLRMLRSPRRSSRLAELTSPEILGTVQETSVRSELAGVRKFRQIAVMIYADIVDSAVGLCRDFERLQFAFHCTPSVKPDCSCATLLPFTLGYR